MSEEILTKEQVDAFKAEFKAFYKFDFDQVQLGGLMGHYWPMMRSHELLRSRLEKAEGELVSRTRAMLERAETAERERDGLRNVVRECAIALNAFELCTESDCGVTEEGDTKYGLVPVGHQQDLLDKCKAALLPLSGVEGEASID